MYRSLLVPVVLATSAAGCVSYTALEHDLGTVAARIGERAGGELTFDRAALLAMRQNPDVLAAAARARAAGVATAPISVLSQWRSAEDMLAVMVDPVAVLGLGPRGGELAELDAAAEAAARELVAVRWRTIGALAEAFLVERTLAAWQPPQIDAAADAERFERAGLASPLAVRRLRAAMARARAERSELDNLRAQNRAELHRLLGLPPTAAVEFALDDPDLLQQPPAGEEALLARPDLLLEQARLHEADAAFRRAVQDQYPSLMIGPEFPLMGGSLQAMAQLSIPIGMHGRAAAARERRDAAVAGLQAAWLAASNGAASAEVALAAAEEVAMAAALAREASEEALRTATVAVQVEVDAFDRLAESAAMAVRDAIEQRMAAIALARAEVRRATAFGWPRTLPEAPPAPEAPRVPEAPPMPETQPGEERP